MGVLDVLTGRMPFWKQVPAGCSTMPGVSTPESEIVRLINSRYKKKPCEKFDSNQLISQAGPEVKELRVTTQVNSDGASKFIILPNHSTAQEVLEVSCQPSADCNLQIFEGEAPFSAIRFVAGDLVWSQPGKKVWKPLYLFCDIPGNIINVEVRSIAIP